jgi:peptidoglycan/xylan/chitin deacetylase (PgdA/CDA1 family)
MNAAKWLSEEALAIFLFHGVIEEGAYAVRNGTGKHLRRDVFEGIIGELATQGTALSMDEVVDHLSRRAPFPPRSFAITFDDGFENNQTVAAPLLEAARMPATFYLATAFVDENGMSWIDRIERSLEHVPSTVIRLPWSDRSRPLGTNGSKTAVLEEIRREAKSRPHLDLDALAETVAEGCGAAPQDAGAGPLDRKLTWDQVRDLDSSPLFTIGGHTHSHAVLSFLDRVSMAEEIDTCMDLLQGETGRRIRHFSYPEGLAHCYDDDVIEALRSRGIVCAPTAEPGVNGQDADPFRLKRINVVD